MSSMYCTCLVALLAVSMVTGKSSQSYFVQKKDYDGMLCSSTNTEPTEASNMLVCARKCRKGDSLQSFFYNSDTGVCTCLTKAVTPGDQCVPSKHSVYFEPHVPVGRYHDTCTESAECTVTNAECWDGVCECVPGYRWSVNDGFCVTDCSSNGLGSTFTNGYKGYDLHCPDVQFLPYAQLITCLEMCHQLPECQSVSYHIGINACMLKICTPLNGLLNEYSMVNTYVRNCSPP